MSGEERTLAPVPAAWPRWDGSPLPPSGALRWGFTTGACACACLTASWLALRGEGSPDHVDLRFGDGATRRLPLEPALPDWPGFTVVRKNAGDDPDCTHGLLVAGRIRPAAATDAPDGRALTVMVEEASVRLHCPVGVGLATRAGLDCAPGRWAVNPGVTHMLAENLNRSGLHDGSWVAEIVIPDGAALAARTLNRSLGVVGGLSLLGTTGLVRPFSHDAYIATVRVCLRAAAAAGDVCVLCTGSRTLRAAREWFAGPGRGHLGPVPDEAFVSIADFIGPALRCAAGLGIRRRVVCCMPGKLLKYAAGHDNTHAHREAQDMNLLGDVCAAVLPGEPDLAARARACPSMRAAMDLLDEDRARPVLDRLAALALGRFLRLCPSPDNSGGNAVPAFALLLSDFSGRAVRCYADDDAPPGEAGPTC